MTRKIIQIAMAASETALSDRVFVVYALCDDGTLWAKTPSKKGDDWDLVDTSRITGADEQTAKE